MNILRFSDLVAQAALLAGAALHPRRPQRPQDASGRITEDTRASAPACRASSMAPDAGAAVMVTTGTEGWGKGKQSPETRSPRWRSGRGEIVGRPVPLVSGWVDGVSVARRVVMLENCRLNPGEKKNDPALAQRWLRCATSACTTPSAPHTAPGLHLRHRRSSPRSPAPAAAGRRDRRHRARAGQPQAAAGGHRRGLQGQHQADHPAAALAARSTSSSSAGHRQHLHARRRACRSARAWPSPTLVDEAQGGDRGDGRAARAVPIPSDVVTAKAFAADAATCGRWPRSGPTR